eukprot:1802553-Rhodomonas_salina.1
MEMKPRLLDQECGSGCFISCFDFGCDVQYSPSVWLVLRACYAMYRGTDLAYGAAKKGIKEDTLAYDTAYEVSAISLRACYAMPGTEI